MSRSPLHPASPEALFRFSVVSQVLARVAAGQVQADAVHTVAAAAHLTLDGQLRRVGARTVYRWLAKFRAEGVAGLEPASRKRIETSVVLPEPFLVFIEEQKKADPRASFPELIKRGRRLGLLKVDETVCRSTVWRAALRMGLETKRRKKQRGGRDVHRFAYPHRMQMMLCDGKHFRAGVTRNKRVALFFLDDATRYGLHVVVGTSESAALFLRGLYETLRQHGLADIFYLDRGPGFIALDTAEAIKNLDALLLHGEAGYPPGRGAVEKFNLTADDAVLRYLDRRPDVDPSCQALELRLQHYLREVYNHEVHESLAGQTPRQRWDSDTRPLRFPADDAELRRKFVVFERRRVTADNTVSYEGIVYEMPLGHTGAKVVLHRHLLDETLSVVHEGRLIRLAPVDLAANATSRRRRPSSTEEAPRGPLPLSAAELAYRQDLGPVVGPDGGFTDPTQD